MRSGGNQRQLQHQCSLFKVPLSVKVLQEGRPKPVTFSTKDLAQALTDKILKSASDQAREAARVTVEAKELASHSSAASRGMNLINDVASLEYAEISEACLHLVLHFLILRFVCFISLFFTFCYGIFNKFVFDKNLAYFLAF